MAATARVFGHSLTRFLKHIRKCHRTPCTSGAQPQPAALPRLGASIRRPAAILALKATLPSQRPFQIKPSTRQGHQSPSNQRHPAPKLVNSSPSSSHPLKVSYTLSPIQRRCECASREGTAPKRREHGVRHRSDSRAWCASTLCFEWMGERHQREHAARLESRHPGAHKHPERARAQDKPVLLAAQRASLQAAVVRVLVRESNLVCVLRLLGVLFHHGPIDGATADDSTKKRFGSPTHFFASPCTHTPRA